MFPQNELRYLLSGPFRNALGAIIETPSPGVNHWAAVARTVCVLENLLRRERQQRLHRRSVRGVAGRRKPAGKRGYLAFDLEELHAYSDCPICEGFECRSYPMVLGETRQA